MQFNHLDHAPLDPADLAYVRLANAVGELIRFALEEDGLDPGDIRDAIGEALGEELGAEEAGL